MGKRLGLARTQALLQNLKRELKLNGSSLAGGVEAVVTAAASSTTALTAADSGKIVFLTPNAAAVTLPAAAAGLSFRIVMAGDYATAACTVTAQAGEFLAGGVTSRDSNHGNDADGSGNLVATFGSAVLAGDYIELHCNGTLWFVSGEAKVQNNGITFSNS